MDAPICPLCGKKEWRHVCNPKGNIRSSPVVTITTPLKNDSGRVETTAGLAQATRDQAKDLLASKEIAATKLRLPGNGKGKNGDEAKGAKSQGKRGRPKTITDFKAHRKVYMRKWRAEKKV